MCGNSRINFSKAELELCVGLIEQLPTSNFHEIVFSGRSNVGKSSLINALLNRKSLARTSSRPGKTATINFYKVDNLRFVDLPGYGWAKVALAEKKRWAKLVEFYFRSDRDIKLIIQIIDIRHDLTCDDFEMINFLRYNKLPFIIVFTKSDKLNKSQLKDRLSYIEKNFKNEKTVALSCVTKEGLEEIREVISSCI